MKKTYSKPQITAIIIESENILAGSGPLGGGNGTPGDAAQVRPMTFEIDDELIDQIMKLDAMNK